MIYLIYISTTKGNRSFMNLEKYKLLKNRSIVQVLDGDIKFGDFEIDKEHYFGVSNLKIAMPYLSGKDICDVAKTFGSTIEYINNKSRWQYMFDLIDYGISSERIPSILAYLFDKSNFTRDINNELSKDEFKKYYEMSVESALEKINEILHFGGNKMVIDNKKVLMVSNSTLNPEISVKNVRNIDSNYIKILAKRAIDNVESGNYDSALTQARTILEETFVYVLEKRNIQPNTKGNINKLYKQVKDEYKMHGNRDADKRVNRLLSGLENIVSSVSEMRNKNSDAHGVGEKRLKIDKHHARLAVNAAITMADFILSVGKRSDGETNY